MIQKTEDKKNYVYKFNQWQLIVPVVLIFLIVSYALKGILFIFNLSTITSSTAFPFLILIVYALAFNFYSKGMALNRIVAFFKRKKCDTVIVNNNATLTIEK
ncbi:hypothetical protein HY637_02035 [Candidatus Woesearchaeota archaeon]|nr:hypothetical protein [Candidatus Woesearchaeota archaeon]